jgi:DNA uptake protein ComE-like DNA-binding protein
VSTRAARGAFTSVDDLSRVPGVGEATLDALRAEVRVSGAVAPARSGDRGAR